MVIDNSGIGGDGIYDPSDNATLGDVHDGIFHVDPDEIEIANQAQGIGCFFALAGGVAAIAAGWALLAFLGAFDGTGTIDESRFRHIGEAMRSQIGAFVIEPSGAEPSDSEADSPDGGGTATETEPQTNPAPPEMPPQAGAWSFTDLAGTMNCGASDFPIPRSEPKAGFVEVIDGGLQLRLTGVGDDLAEVLVDLVDNTPGAVTYVGGVAPEDAVDGVELVFTGVFDTPTSATTHIGGALVAEGLTCAIDRPGEATYVGP